MVGLVTKLTEKKNNKKQQIKYEHLEQVLYHNMNCNLLKYISSDICAKQRLGSARIYISNMRIPWAPYE